MQRKQGDLNDSHTSQLSCIAGRAAWRHLGLECAAKRRLVTRGSGLEQGWHKAASDNSTSARNAGDGCVLSARPLTRHQPFKRRRTPLVIVSKAAIMGAGDKIQARSAFTRTDSGSDQDLKALKPKRRPGSLSKPAWVSSSKSHFL